MAKRETRAAQRSRLLDEAAAITLPERCDVAVVGGGAAGLAAAIAAARAGAEVVVLERGLLCGEPILATGNGRCNFANVNLDLRRYNDPTFVEMVCGPSWLDDILAFFRDCGLRWCLKQDRLYPMSRQAASVRNVLVRRAHEMGVTLACARELTSLGWDKGAGLATLEYAPSFAAGSSLAQEARTVVLAAGKSPLPSLDALGLRSTGHRPALCPVACEKSPLAELDGRRAHARVSLTKAGSFFPTWSERGEMLFRSYGISGIVSFDLSRRVARGDLVEIDLTPDLSKSELQQLVGPFATGAFEPGCLDGAIDPAIATVLEELARARWRVTWPERPEPASDSEALIGLVKALPMIASGLAQTEHAQITQGGLANDQFDPQTLASRAHPWLFACGEALDVDADCGGFNLAWAWKSGLVAGAAAAERAVS